MTTMVALFVLLVVPIALAMAVMTMPRWSGRVIHRNHLWNLHDDVVDDVLAGRLPARHAGVRFLLEQIDDAAKDCTRMSLLKVYAYKRVLRKHDAVVRRVQAIYTRSSTSAGLTADQLELLESRRHRFQLAITGNLLFGSWLGLAYFVALFVAAVSRAITRSLAASWGRSSDRLDVALNDDVRTVVRKVANEPSDRLDEWVRGVCMPGVRTLH